MDPGHEHTSSVNGAYLVLLRIDLRSPDPAPPLIGAVLEQPGLPVPVPSQQAESIAEKLKGAGVEAKLVVKPGAAHGWPDLPKDSPGSPTGSTST